MPPPLGPTVPGNSKIGVQNRNSHKNKNSNPVETMNIADFVVLDVHPRYSHIESESECPRVEGNGEYTEMICSLCFLIDCFDREVTAQQLNLETVDKYIYAWMLNKSRSPGFVEVEALESLFTFVAQFDSRAAQICLSDEMDLHGFPLFRMRLIDLSHHAAREMVCWGEGTAEHARRTQSLSHSTD
eukprot:scaffold142834_cov44-Attheya_sp.AAC.1